jgi:hypothetical protein
MKPKENSFCYSFKRWNLAPESKKPFKKFVLEAIETCKDDLASTEGMDEVYFETGSPLRELPFKKQLLLLDNLKDAVSGKPFVGMSSTSDYLLEELLYSVIKVSTEISLDMEEECPYAKESANRIREVYELNNENARGKTSHSKILDWVKSDLWHDIDWASFKVDPKEYEEVYLSGKSTKGKVKDLPIINI